MAISQRGRQSRKATGGRYKSPRAKKKHELGRRPTNTTIAEKEVKKELRGRGGCSKEILLNASTVNLLNPKTKKFEKVRLKTVAESPANLNYIRRNILTRGSIVETEKGKARITSRPGQNGSLNAVLI